MTTDLDPVWVWTLSMAVPLLTSSSLPEMAYKYDYNFTIAYATDLVWPLRNSQRTLCLG